MTSCDVSILKKSDLWDAMDAPPIYGDLCALTLDRAAFIHETEVGITLTDDAAIQALNKQHRGKDKATNVLSFPAYDPDLPHPAGAPVELGDIVLAYETIAREATEQGKSFHDHVTHLIIHGTLHLIGHDHEQDDEAETMEALEVRILAELGIKNPYADE